MVLIYTVFFLSGAAALMYEVAWVRQLSLVFGGTHLAVTTVLSIFMGGLALGSALIGKRVDKVEKPLQLYAFLELGIALAAVVFIVLMKIYPFLYDLFVTGESSRLYRTVVRIVFAFIALIIPTTLMGGTLPVLTRFVSRHPGVISTKLSLLYGFNTLGAVAGTAGAGFVLLSLYSLSTTLYTAILINVLIGIGALLLQKRAGQTQTVSGNENRGLSDTGGNAADVLQHSAVGLRASLPLKLVLIGIGISGFCALGYEVLWTRILTLTIGTSVYGFTIMLVAFLTGIALGSKAYGVLVKTRPFMNTGLVGRIVWFGVVQLIIGGAALLVTFHIRDLPVHSVALKNYFLDLDFEVFAARQWANMALAFIYMFLPAFFMGVAFPIAGEVNIAQSGKLGQAVGEVLAFNTVGAIFGSVVSGFFLIYILGIERSLQMLTIVNIGLGLLVIVSLMGKRLLNWGVALACIASLLFLSFNDRAFRIWDMKFFAIFQNNQPESYDTPFEKRDAIKNTDVLYYHEGADSTISVIKVKGGNQAVLVNGKVVASADLGDRQCQYTLGHLPMLVHPDPRKVLVVGLGTGMTLGATAVHPSVEELTLAEIEPGVLGAARTFAQYNNNVLDDPKLKIVFNDGRNYLMTTKEKYDVITADPIHPWTRGSGYLYTAEYFKLASEHLLPDGVMCQWLPIYEMSVDDLKSVVKTFSHNFKYTMTWLTAHDAEIIGSNSPIIFDEGKLQRRIDYPAIANNLKQVMMGSSEEFLSYFIMATARMKAFGEGGIINTDDNMHLEFSAPRSLETNTMGLNTEVLARYRESITPYLVPAGSKPSRELQLAKWERNYKASLIADRAHADFLFGRYDSPEFHDFLATLSKEYPHFSPGRFLRKEYANMMALIPKFMGAVSLDFFNKAGEKKIRTISAVRARVSGKRAAIIFVDNDARVVFGQRYFTGDDIDEKMDVFAHDVLAGIQELYRAKADTALKKSGRFPSEALIMPKIKRLIKTECKKKG